MTGDKNVADPSVYSFWSIWVITDRTSKYPVNQNVPKFVADVLFHIFMIYFLAATSRIFLILGLTKSRILTPLNLLWFKFGMLLGRIVSPIVMGLVFFLVVTPTGLIMRGLKKDLLKLKKKKSNTYWVNRDQDNTDMRNQF